HGGVVVHGERRRALLGIAGRFALRPPHGEGGERIVSAPAWNGPLRLDARTIARAMGLPSPTDAQKAVIEAPPVPALVVAGAGSGKAEAMSARVVWLVANGHVSASEVLGLTFTRKAAGELAERIAARLERVREFGERG